jgi:EAL domain-containing protein (putative c-di-GMP-specific phosphodiesterase class I)
MRNRPRTHFCALTRAALTDDRLRIVSEPIVTLATRARAAEELLLGLAADRAGARPRTPALSDLTDLDVWMTGRAARLSRYGRQVHVRVSAASVCTPAFLGRARLAIAYAEADPRRITLEISEEVAAHEPESARAFCDSVNDALISVALGDVRLRPGAPADLIGRGVRVLKIDPWCTRAATTEARSRRTVTRIVELARAAGIQSVASGPVDRQAFVWLREIGVDCLQEPVNGT